MGPRRFIALVGRGRMRIASAVILIAVFSAGQAVGQSTLPQPPAEIMPRNMVRLYNIIGSANSVVLTRSQASHHWNGKDELLLVPDDGPPPHDDRGRFASFTIGAAFSTEGIENEPAADCLRRVALAQLDGGALQIEEYPVVLPQQASSYDARRAADGRTERIIQSGRCRYVLYMVRKIMGVNGWQDAGAPVEPLDGSRGSVDPGSTASEQPNKSQAPQRSKLPVRTLPEKTVKRAPTPPRSAFFRELNVNALRFVVGDNTAASTKAVESCPRASGAIIFERSGLHVKMPWSDRDEITPGILRDPAGRVTTLIFQNAKCRSELQVVREMNLNGIWQRSPLAPTPPSGPDEDFRPGVDHQGTKNTNRG